MLPQCQSQLTSLPALPQVWRALCIPYNEEVAVKLLDLENVNCSLVRCCKSLQSSPTLQNLTPW